MSNKEIEKKIESTNELTKLIRNSDSITFKAIVSCLRKKWIDIDSTYFIDSFEDDWNNEHWVVLTSDKKMYEYDIFFTNESKEIVESVYLDDISYQLLRSKENILLLKYLF